MSSAQVSTPVDSGPGSANDDRHAARDPLAFVAAAEAATNAADAPAAAALYAKDAVLEVITDGARERHVGSARVGQAWAAYFEALGAAGLHVTKELLAAEDRVIVNRWSGTRTGLLGRSSAANVTGVEYWRFDDDGLVVSHQLYGFLNVRPSNTAGARLRLVTSYPRLAIRLLLAQRRHGL
jgi:ketosteroid isomerase-like protein